MLNAVHIHPDGDVGGLVAHVSTVFDLDHQSVQIDHRIQRLQRPPLPGQDLLADLVGDLGDRLMRQFGADRGDQVVLDVAQRHPAGIQADDHLIEAAEPA